MRWRFNAAYDREARAISSELIPDLREIPSDIKIRDDGDYARNISYDKAAKL